MPDLRSATKFNGLTPSRFVMPVASVTSTSYSASNTSGLIIVNSTTAGAGVTVTLATAAGNTGQTITIKNTGTAGSMFAVTVATTSSQTIDGGTSCIVPAVFGAFVTVVSDGSNWQVVDYSVNLPQTAACTTTNSAVSSTETDVAGCSLSVVVPRNGAVVVISAAFDMQPATTSITMTGILTWNGSDQASEAVAGSTTGRATVGQNWVITGATPGTYTAKLRVSATSGTTSVLRATHTTITAAVY